MTKFEILQLMNCKQPLKKQLVKESQQNWEQQAAQSWTNNPNFQFVCMPPTKQVKASKNMNGSQNGEQKSMSMIEPNVLKNIIGLQAIRMREFGSKQVLRLDKMGLCGIPSLWMNRDELIKESHLSSTFLDEEERLRRIYKIMKTHKKWENEKYFGPSYKRGMNMSSIQNAQNQLSECIQFSADILYSKYKNPPKEEGKAEGNEQNALPSIKQFDLPDQMLFRVMHAEAKLVKLILETHGFQQTDSNDWNVLWTCNGTSSKAYIYEALNECQKINHFVNSTELTRKDRLCSNVDKMQQKFGRNHFDFLPETYIIPEEFNEFNKAFNCHSKNERNLWIVKPSCSSQGKGIFMIDDIAEVPLNESLVVSKYIENPLLINGLKFDIRLYVLVTSVEPLRIYIYNEGLVRFASEPYNISSVKSNIYAHLTNYSINKKSENFIQNKTVNERDSGHKWSLSALQLHMQKMGINMDLVWDRVYDSIIKSFISVENSVYQAVKKVPTNANNAAKQNSFDLFGFDIILDTDLKPWILEVNLSPSLAFDSPLDYHLKSNLIIDALNIVGLRRYIRRKEVLGKQLKVKQTSISINNNQQKQDNKKRYPSALNISQIEVQNSNILNKTDHINAQQIQKDNTSYEGIEISHFEKLSKISAKHREILRDTFEEFARNKKNNFTRLYPAPGSNQYDMYFEQPRHLNKMVYKYLYQFSELSDIMHQNGGQHSIGMDLKSTIEEGTGGFGVGKPQQQQQQQQPQQQQQQQLNRKKNSCENTVLLMQTDKKVQHATFSNKTDHHQQQQQQQQQQYTVQKNRSSSLSSMSIQRGQYDLYPKNQTTESKENDSSSNGIGEGDDNASLLSSSIKEEKVVITGDDILIEYVTRLINRVKMFPIQDLSNTMQKRLDQFLNHKVWSQNAQQLKQLALHLKIENRCQEMQERKKRIFMKGDHDPSSSHVSKEQRFRDQEKQKNEIIKDFTSIELEKMLIQSNQNNQLEVVGILVNSLDGGGGILTKLERESRRVANDNLQNTNTKQLSMNMYESFSGEASEFITPKNPSLQQSNDISKQINLKKINSYSSQMLSDESTLIQQSNKLHTSQHKMSPYYSSQASSKSNLQVVGASGHSQKKQNPGTTTTSTTSSAVSTDKNLFLKSSVDNRFVLPQIKTANQQHHHHNHLMGSDFSRSSIQLTDNNASNSDTYQKYRSRMANDNYLNNRRAKGPSGSTTQTGDIIKKNNTAHVKSKHQNE